METHATMPKQESKERAVARALEYCFVSPNESDINFEPAHVVVDALYNRPSPKEAHMFDWLLNLPVVWMAIVIFGGTYIGAGVINWIVRALAVGARAEAFKD